AGGHAAEVEEGKEQAGEDAGLGRTGWPGEDVPGDRGAARRGCDDRLAADEGRRREAASDCAEVRHRDQIASACAALLARQGRGRGCLRGKGAGAADAVSAQASTSQIVTEPDRPAASIPSGEKPTPVIEQSPHLNRASSSP